MAITTYILFFIAMILYMTPFIFWFLNRLAITKGTHNWRKTRNMKLSFYYCLPIASVCMIIGVVINFA